MPNNKTVPNNIPSLDKNKIKKTAIAVIETVYIWFFKNQLDKNKAAISVKNK